MNSRIILIDGALPAKDIQKGVGFDVGIDPRARKITISIRANEQSAIKIAVVLQPLDNHGKSLQIEGKGFGVSKAFGLPFYYYDGFVNSTRSLDLPENTHRLRIDLINWLSSEASISELIVATTGPMRLPKITRQVDTVEVIEPDNEDIDTTPIVLGSREKFENVVPGSTLSHSLETRCPESDQIIRNASVLLPRFYDENQILIEDQINSLPVSTSVGPYKYVPAGPNITETVVTLSVPNSGHYYGYKLQPWKDSNGQLISTKVKTVGFNKLNQHKKIQNELETLSDFPADDIVLIYTGTTRIGEKNRANRSMMMALELSKLGKKVIYIYYRGDQNVSITEDQTAPSEGEGYVVQIPNDIFPEFSDLVVSLGQDSGVAIMTMPDAGSLTLLSSLRTNGWQTICEARDDWEEFRSVGSGKWYHTDFERYLARTCDFSISVSPPLRDKMIAFGCDQETAHILPNGAGQAFYDYALCTSAVDRVPSDKSNRRIGYFGHLTPQWFDWGALFSLAQQRPDLEIDIVGHGATPERELPNLNFLGPKAHTDIIELAKSWEIGLIPFVPSRLANAVDPIKIYEYFCLSLKVVSVRMEQIETYPNTFLYNSSNEFSDTVIRSLETPFDTEANKDFIANCSWAHRIKELLALLDRNQRGPR